jgi:hypothetical protein
VRYNTYKALDLREVLGKIVAGLVWAMAAETTKPTAHFAMVSMLLHSA